MPSPIGHLITGAAIGRTLTSEDGRLVIACACLAAAPDLDLLVPGTHRTVTHSVTAVAIVTIFAILVTDRVTGVGPGVRPRARYGDRFGVRPRVWIVIALVAAYASHLLLDWLGADPTPPNGLQLLWPFSDQWFISGLDIFRGTARRNLFTARTLWINATAIAQEIAITGPIAWLSWRATRPLSESPQKPQKNSPQSHRVTE